MFFSAATTRDSIPFRVPNHRTSMPFSINILATASAGYTCPPVPPAIITTVFRSLFTAIIYALTKGFLVVELRLLFIDAFFADLRFSLFFTIPFLIFAARFDGIRSRHSWLSFSIRANNAKVIQLASMLLPP